MRNRIPGLAALTVGLAVLCAVPAGNAQTVTKILGRDSVTVADVLPSNTAPVVSNRPLVVTLHPSSSPPSGIQNVNLQQVGGIAIALGQALMTASIPVAIASNQSPLNITGTVIFSTDAGTTATTTAVALTTTGAQVFANTASVKARKIYNRSGNPIVYCVYFSGTNVTSEATASFAIAAGQTWEMPTLGPVVEYTGQINCATASSTGSVQALQVL